MEKNCIALTFYGTVGLEFAYFKKPALYASSIFYTKANAGIEPTSKEQYFGLLRNPEPLYTFVEENHETIKRFAYHYLFRRNLRVPFYLQDKVWLGNCIDWSLLADYPGLIKNDPIIKHISQSILEGKDVVNQD